MSAFGFSGLKGVTRLAGSVVLGALLATTVSAPASAQRKPEESIAYRQGLMKVHGWHMGALGAMAKGNAPFDADRATRSLKVLAGVAIAIPEGFPAGSDKGAEHWAQPEVWSKPDAFKAEADKFAATVASAAGMGGNLDDLKKAVGMIGGGCGSCHNDFKRK